MEKNGKSPFDGAVVRIEKYVEMLVSELIKKESNVIVNNGPVYNIYENTISGGNNAFGGEMKETGRKGAESCGLPSVLSTPEAVQLWEVLKKEQWVDEQLQPNLPRWKMALLADAMAKKLHILNKWVCFERLWNMSAMKQEFQKGQRHESAADFYKELDRLGL